MSQQQQQQQQNNDINNTNTTTFQISFFFIQRHYSGCQSAAVSSQTFRKFHQLLLMTELRELNGLALNLTFKANRYFTSALTAMFIFYTCINSSSNLYQLRYCQPLLVILIRIYLHNFLFCFYRKLALGLKKIEKKKIKLNTVTQCNKNTTYK